MAQAGMRVADQSTMDALVVDPTSKAARATLYDSRGNLRSLSQKLVGSYQMPVLFPALPVGTTDVTAPYTLWRMFSIQPGVSARIRKMSFMAFNVLGNSGSPGGLSSRWEMYRFTGFGQGITSGVNYMGQTAAQPQWVVAKKKSAGFPRSAMTAQVASDPNVALNEAGVIADKPFCSFGVPRAVAAQKMRNGVPFDLSFPTGSEFWLDPGEGLGARQMIDLAANSFIGDIINGYVEYDEFTWDSVPK